MSGVLPTQDYPDADPHDVDQIIDRLHIGTLKRDQLRARKSIIVSDDDGPITHQELEDLYKSETYSVTSEESQETKKIRRKTSGASSSSGEKSYTKGKQRADKKEGLPRHEKPEKQPKPSRSIEVQTTIGKGQGYTKLQDVYAAEEGLIHHHKEKHDSKPSKLSRLFSKKKGAHSSDDVNGNAEAWVSLPQTFLCKYMGKRSCKGYQGVKYTSPPVEEVVESVNQLPKGLDLPLVKVEISTDGMSMVPHKRNKVKNFEPVSIPIRYVSYGTQDQNYPRIFCFIMVREMSSHSKKLDCHVYAADSSKNARKMAGCLAFAFELHAEKTQGRHSPYATDIKPDPLYEHDDAKSSYDV